MRWIASRAMLAAALLSGAVLASLGRAEAAPVQFGDSYYEYVTHEAISWENANLEASGRTFMGVNGHLATVTSQAENDFLVNLSPTYFVDEVAWLGGAVDATQAARWVVGPEAGQLMSFDNFASGQPNSGPSNVWIRVPTLAGIMVGQWGDAAGGLSGLGNHVIGYFVEYQVGTVPLPAALPLMLTGLAGFGFVGWRRKRAMANVTAG